MEFRYVIHYCYLRGMKPKDIKEEMQIAYKDQAPGDSTIYKWFNRFKDGRENVDDDRRSGRPLNCDDNARILQILSEQPFASARYISDMLQIPKPTVCHKLVWQLNYRKLNCRWIPHDLEEKNKKQRVEMCKQMLQILENNENEKYEIVTGDEVWIYWRNDNTSQWLHVGEKRPLVPKVVINSKKSMFSIFLSLYGFVVVKMLPNGEKFNSDFMIHNVLPEIPAKIAVLHPKRSHKNILVHMDNAPSHNSKITSDEISKLKMKRIPHPAYSPDIAICDFWLFGKLKDHLKGTDFQTENELFEAVLNFLDTIEKNEIKRVFEEWIVRLHKVIDSGGDYVIK